MPGAFSGTYSDLRFVKSRKVAQIIIEIPIEQADGFIQAFGTPNPASETWCAIARLAIAQDQSVPQKIHKTKSWDELRLSQQAAIRCSDETYRHWLCVDDEESAKSQVRKACEVDSRAELDTDEAAANRWQAMEEEFATWKRTRHL
jgi:hypothetical protein